MAEHNDLRQAFAIINNDVAFCVTQRKHSAGGLLCYL